MLTNVAGLPLRHTEIQETTGHTATHRLGIHAGRY